MTWSRWSDHFNLNNFYHRYLTAFRVSIQVKSFNQVITVSTFSTFYRIFPILLPPSKYNFSPDFYRIFTGIPKVTKITKITKILNPKSGTRGHSKGTFVRRGRGPAKSEQSILNLKCFPIWKGGRDKKLTYLSERTFWMAPYQNHQN